MASSRAAHCWHQHGIRQRISADGETLACRFVAQYEVGLPNKQAREDILKVILARHGRDMAEECVSAELLKVGCIIAHLLEAWVAC